MKYQNKPPYVVPTMAEIAAMPYNGYEAISTFSGAGGSCLGYRMAGYNVLWANEFVRAAQQTYKANFPNTFLDHRDIREITPEDLLETIGRDVGEIDLMDGSPPCAAFSNSGLRHKKWNEVRKYSDTKQRVDDLFFEFARLLVGVQPKVFIAENVQGLVRGVAKGFFKNILEELKKCGYNVQAKLVKANLLGVPTTRPRLFFIGVRNDLGLDPHFPKPLPYQYTLRDAIPWIDKPDTDPSVPYVDPEVLMEGYTVGKRWEKLAVGEQDKVRFNLIRCHPDKPVQTITQRNDASVASVTHPYMKRKFSIIELKRLSSFPEDFILTGDYKRQSERIGRAVPPLVMKALAETVAVEILDRIPKTSDSKVAA